MGMEQKFAEVPEDLWNRVAPLLPRKRPKPKEGRPRVGDRMILAGILYRLRTGCQWKARLTCPLRLDQACRECHDQFPASPDGGRKTAEGLAFLRAVPGFPGRGVLPEVRADERRQGLDDRDALRAGGEHTSVEHR